MSLHQFKDQFILLLEAGFIAINQADEESAKALFHAAHLLNHRSPMPDIGLGYLHFHKLELKAASQKFLQVLEREPENEMARTFIGMCYSLSPQLGTEGEQILTQVVENAKTTEAKAAAKAALDFVQHHVRKRSSPKDLHSHKHK